MDTTYSASSHREGTAVSARGLRKSYGSTTAVDGIDLDISAGEVFALLGPNGAGKSTAVEILEGFRHRDAGEVHVLGADPGTAGRSWRARIGIVWQHRVEGSPLTPLDVVRHFAGYYPESWAPEEVLERVGLGDKARARVRSLSGGQSRRLDVALGIVGRPELLFLDEPTTGFDPEARRRFWTLIRDLAGEGTTIVLTTHYLDEAEALADRVAVISKGRIVARGTPATLGGRAEALATVSWTDDGHRQQIRTAEPTRVVAELMPTFPGEIPELSVHRPTLEETYLRLIEEPGADAQESPAESREELPT
ncbi:ABC-2 type transport system ATP-binding protein [Lipingzhangella halophila]|uniref:ABC-2 type transport system ATP-binding protein n=1 Tax=Lipingzhangella halophila TaxID=1783352 RepID=A0A7W7RJZ7_9ACTN|nr:ABC transporter ATP-binding protein [Lipingzhangella halophila]MBB4933409.1 ABC-2 type transport system ATP-binding protein [Lipingzhangella halophila]